MTLETNPTNQPVEPGIEGVSAQQGAPSPTEANNPPAGTGNGDIAIERDGVKVLIPQAEIADYVAKGVDYTKKTQLLSEKEKAWQAEIQRLTAQINNPQANPENYGEGQEQDVVTQITERMGKLESTLADVELEKKLVLVREKYPNISDDMLLTKFTKMADEGKIRANMDGLMAAGEAANQDIVGIVNKQLQSVMDSTDPKHIELRNNIIKQYVAGKIKMINAGGEPGGSPAAVKPGVINNLDDAVKASMSAHIPQTE